MPIHSLHTPSQTSELFRSLTLFRDRLDARAAFARYVNADAPMERILYFHGDGGNGKSLLLHKLRSEYCRRVRDVAPWQDVLDAARWSELGANDKVARLAAFDGQLRSETSTPVPFASLDFGGPARWLQDLREPVSALSELRRQLARHRFRFPLFDYAMLLWLQKSGQLHKGKLEEYFGSEHVDLASQLLETAENIPFASAAPKLLKILLKFAWGKHLDMEVTRRIAKWKVDDAEAVRLSRLDNVSELPLELPVLLARDLNAALEDPDARHQRVALFFDTHDAFWARGGHSESRGAFHVRDQWLRSLLGALDLQGGVIVVVSGRERPRWAEAPEQTAIGAEYIDHQAVGLLGSADATDYLRSAGVDDAAGIDRLLAAAAVESGQHHPLYLGLCADAFLARKSRSTDMPGTVRSVVRTAGEVDSFGRERELLDRLLMYCDDQTEDAIKVLSAARSFDWSQYREVGSELGLPTDHATFHRLTGYSFVRVVNDASERGDDTRYRIHDLIRRVIRVGDDPRIEAADRALHASFHRRSIAGDELAQVEALYHLSQFDSGTAASQWLGAIEKATRLARHGVCQSLIHLMEEMGFPDRRRRSDAYWRAGNYWESCSNITAALASYEVAESEIVGLATVQPACAPSIDQVPDLLRLGSIHLKVCDALLQHSRLAEAESACLRSIQYHQDAVDLEPAGEPAWNGLGMARHGMAKLLTTRSDERARTEYREALQCFERALELKPEDVPALNNAGTAHHNFAEFLVRLGALDEAEAEFSCALGVLRRALASDPNSATVRLNLGSALAGLGALKAQQEHPAISERLYREALQNLDGALELAPRHRLALNLRGVNQTRLAHLLAEQDRHDLARDLFGSAIETYGKLLDLAPGYAGGWMDLGIAHSELGDQQAKLGDAIAAERHYRQAISAYATAGEIAPADSQALVNLGLTQKGLAEALTSLMRQDEAREAWSEAIQTYRKALEIAPNEASTWRALGRSHVELAQALGGGQSCEDEETHYRAAIECYRRAWDLQPAGSSASAWNSLGFAQRQLGALLQRRADSMGARDSYLAAADSYQQVTELQPTDADGWRNFCYVCLQVGSLSQSGKEFDAAQSSYTRALESYRRALSAVGYDVGIARNLLSAQHQMVELLLERQMWKEAASACVESLQLCEDFAQRSPDESAFRNAQGVACVRLAQLVSSTDRQAGENLYQAAIEAYRHGLSLAPDDRMIEENLQRATDLLEALRTKH